MIQEPGKYSARAIKWSWSEAKTGTMQLAIEFAVKVPMGDGSEGADTITHYLPVTEKTIERATKTFRLMGYVGDSLEELDNSGGNLDANEVELDVQWDEYNGESRLKVKWINEPGAGFAIKAPEASALRGFAERMKGAMRAVDAGAPKAAVPVATPKPALAKPPQRAAAPTPPAQTPWPVARQAKPAAPEQDAGTGDDIPPF